MRKLALYSAEEEEVLKMYYTGNMQYFDISECATQRGRSNGYLVECADMPEQQHPVLYECVVVLGCTVDLTGFPHIPLIAETTNTDQHQISDGKMGKLMD